MDIQITAYSDSISESVREVAPWHINLECIQRSRRCLQHVTDGTPAMAQASVNSWLDDFSQYDPVIPQIKYAFRKLLDAGRVRIGFIANSVVADAIFEPVFDSLKCRLRRRCSG